MAKADRDGPGFRWVWEERDHYEILEIPRDASTDEVNRAFRFQQNVWHPDKSGDVERTKRILQARDVLLDPAERRKYDLIFLPEPASGECFEGGDQRDPRIWKRMASWMKEEDVATPFHRKMVFQAGDLLERRRQPTEKQLKWMREGWKLAMDAGFDAANELEDE